MKYTWVISRTTLKLTVPQKITVKTRAQFSDHRMRTSELLTAITQSNITGKETEVVENREFLIIVTLEHTGNLEEDHLQ